jgi:hypothetical protein
LVSLILPQTKAPYRRITKPIVRLSSLHITLQTSPRHRIRLTGHLLQASTLLACLRRPRLLLAWLALAALLALSPACGDAGGSSSPATSGVRATGADVPAETRPARAYGPSTISLGEAEGTAIAVLLAGDAQPYNAFNLHVQYQVGGDLADVAVSGSVVQSTLSAGGSSPLCLASPAPGRSDAYVYSCVKVTPGLTATGELARLSFSARGNGCLVVRLGSKPGDPVHHTFTLDGGNANTAEVDVTPRTLRFGSGVC